MSNAIRRPPLRGVIVYGERIVGGVDLPSPCESFIEHFNQEYAAVGLRVLPADQLGDSALGPVEQQTSDSTVNSVA
jgi:hypothetical protein